MAIRKRPGLLPEDFYHNFRETTYGSDVVSACSVSPKYCLVYFNSNETDVGLGMVPSEEPALTDKDGNMLDTDWIEGGGPNHFFKLDDTVVIVGPPVGENGKRPFVELDRKAELYDAMFLSAESDVQAKIFNGKSFTDLELVNKEDALLYSLMENKVSVDMLCDLKKKASKDKKRTRRWGDIALFKETLTLPKGVTQVGNIELIFNSSLTLPKGVTRVGDIKLHSGPSLALPKGVTKMGDIALHGGSSLTLPEGATQVKDIVLSGGSSLVLPEGVTQVGNIALIGGSSLSFPEVVTKVGNVELNHNSSLILPEGVTRVGNIILDGGSSLTLSEGVTEVGDIKLLNASSLTLPKGVTEVGDIVLYLDASITFPDGYVLKNSSDDYDVGDYQGYMLKNPGDDYGVGDYEVLEFFAEDMNQLLSEHQKFLEKETPMSMQASETKEPVSESMVEQSIDPEGLQGQRMFVVYPEDVSEGHPLPMSVEGRLTNDGKAYVSFSDINRIIPKDGLIMVKNPNCNIYEAFDRKTFDLLYQMNHDGTASRKKQSETMKPGIRKKPSLKKLSLELRYKRLKNNVL